MKIKVKNKNELIELLKTSELSDIDTSLITDMSKLFLYSGYKNRDFKGIETWDVSNVTDMSFMFDCAEHFNADISKWDVSKVKDMESMFCGAKSFNQNISSWDVKNVVNFNKMFFRARSFNQNLSSWDINGISKEMFEGTKMSEKHKPKTKEQICV
ncbi:BspA family leucine-rich repeat surface protein [Helicobacter labetoulli]|uniref:BspA family leucine-rich repeat surface protein n=2 Tax=Helicobacter labetoulli TaxID=2315333 RepID=UPI0039E791E4